MTAREIFKSVTFYPMSGLYVGGVILAALGARNVLLWQWAFVAFGFLFVILLLIASRRELAQVHRLVNGQRHEMMDRVDHLTILLTKSNERIEELTGLLISQGIQFPPSDPATKQERQEIAREQTGKEVQDEDSRL